MFRIFVKFTCIDGMREKFVERVRKEGILDAILAEDGCHAYNYYFSEADKNELLLIEYWETQKHQQVHLDQPHMEKLRSFKNEYVTNTELGEFELK